MTSRHEVIWLVRSTYILSIIIQDTDSWYCVVMTCMCMFIHNTNDAHEISMWYSICASFDWGSYCLLLTLYLSVVSIPSSNSCWNQYPRTFLYWQYIEGSVSVIVESLEGLHNFPTTTLQFVFNKLSFCKATHKTFPCDVPNYFYNNNNCSIELYFPLLYV